MANKVARVVVSAVAATLLFGVTGCASGAQQESKPSASAQQADKTPAKSESAKPANNDALESYIEAERSQIPQVLEANPGVYSDVTIEQEPPSTVVFTFTYASQVDPAAATEYFEQNLDTLQNACDSGVFPAMKKAGVEGEPSAVYHYLNPDGSTIWKKTFTPS